MGKNHWKVIREEGVEKLYPKLLKLVISQGREIAPRGLTTRELSPLIFQLLNPRKRMMTYHQRRLNYPLAIMKQLFMLHGSVDIECLCFYDPSLRSSIEPTTGLYDGAYGARVRPQLEYVWRLLQQDQDTRRAVIAIFRPDDHRPGLDIPSTVSLQFLLRQGYLDAIVYMRSNDIWGGLPYDLCLFPFLQEVLASWLNVELGTYTHIAGSGHIYLADREKIVHLQTDTSVLPSTPAPRFTLSYQETWPALEEFLNRERTARIQREWGEEEKPKDEYLRWCAETIVSAYARPEP